MRILQYCDSTKSPNLLYVAVKDSVVILDLLTGLYTNLCVPAEESSASVLQERQKHFNDSDDCVSVVAMAHNDENLTVVAFSDKVMRVFDHLTGKVLATAVMPKRPT